MKMKQNGGFTLIELLVVITIIAILASFAVPVFNKVVTSAQQTKQINNLKQIALACSLFASDNSGIYPTGGIVDGVLTDAEGGNAEDCFNDLMKTGALAVEKVFWNPQNKTMCKPSAPNENNELQPGENCWEYMFGLSNSSSPTLPLVYEASNGGTTWAAADGHPWETKMIVAFVDGSAEKVNLSTTGEAKVNRNDNIVDLCVPVPGSDGWPASAARKEATAGGAG